MCQYPCEGPEYYLEDKACTKRSICYICMYLVLTLLLEQCESTLLLKMAYYPKVALNLDINFSPGVTVGRITSRC